MPRQRVRFNASLPSLRGVASYWCLGFDPLLWQTVKLAPRSCASVAAILDARFVKIHSVEARLGSFRSMSEFTLLGLKHTVLSPGRRYFPEISPLD